MNKKVCEILGSTCDKNTGATKEMANLRHKEGLRLQFLRVITEKLL